MKNDQPTPRGPLLSWQWSLYGGNHTDRGNLLLHVATVPVFQLGTLALAGAALAALRAGPLAGAASAFAGLAMMGGAMALQGRGHKREAAAPVPFEGPLDVASRILVEQWVTFPRYALSGGLARAWRASSPSPSPSRS